MRLRRRTASRTRRQVLHSDDLTPPPPPLIYRTRRSEETRSTGRQAPGEVISLESRRHAAYAWLQRLGLIILLVAILVSLVNVLTLSSDAKVIPIGETTNRSFLRPTTVYQQAATQLLSRSIWNHNKITIDTNRVSQQLLAQFPELSSVSVTMPLLAHRPLVYVEPAQPVLILVAKGGSFVIDTTGKALLMATNQTAINQLNLPLVNDQTGLDVRLNHQVLSVNNVEFIQTVTAQLAAKQFTISSMALPATASELDLHLNGQPYFVKFNLQSPDPKREAGTFLATISQLHRQNVTPSQYIDVRVDGRAYYR